MDVREIMSKNFVSLGPDDTIQAFMSAMERYHIHSVPVIEKGKLLGNLEYKKLSKKGIIDPSTAKIRSFMDSPPPTLKPDSTVEAAADVLFKSRMRALPVVEKGKVIGVVSVWDIMDVAARTKCFRQTTADAIMSPAETINVDDDLGKARVFMREKDISRLPVVNADGKLVGVLTVFDMLRAIKPRERQGWFSMAAEVDRIMGCPVSTVMNKNPVIAGPRTSLSEIASMMVQHKTSGIIITDGAMPLGVVTIKDLLEVYVAGLSQKGVYYQVIGLEDEDEMTINTVDRMIRDT
ncbi:MAG: CBS domain-containing protein, partial [Candidatus Aenigmatarchaeota archaeon]